MKIINIKIGDKVAAIQYDVSNWQSSQHVNWGYVFYIDDNKVGVARHNMSPIYVNLNSETEKLYYIDSEAKTNMHKLIDQVIYSYSKQIKKLTSEEKDELIKTEFENIKQKITNTAKNMVNCNWDESDYINRLKEICRLKDKMFKIKVSDLDNVHKKNSVIKARIRNLQELKDKVEKLSFEE